MLRRISSEGKIAFFMSADKIKFRQAVVPGDQLLLDVTAVRLKERSAHVQGVAKVGDQVAAEATIKFVIVDAGRDS